MRTEHESRIVDELAERTGVEKEAVAKVLSELGLSEALGCVNEAGVSLQRLTLSNAKMAFRVGKNMVCV